MARDSWPGGVQWQRARSRGNHVGVQGGLNQPRFSQRSPYAAFDPVEVRHLPQILVNALALTDEKPDAIVQSISARQARLRELENQVAGARAAPKAVEDALTCLVEVAYAAIKRFNETLANHPDQAREVVAAAFEKIMFTPEKTPDGPRYRLDGTGNLGRLLGLDDDAKWASPAGVEPVTRGRRGKGDPS